MCYLLIMEKNIMFMKKNLSGMYFSDRGLFFDSVRFSKIIGFMVLIKIVIINLKMEIYKKRRLFLFLLSK